MMKKYAFALAMMVMSFVGGAFGTQVINFAQSAVSTVLPSNLQPGTGGMWSDVDTQAPVIWNQSDRAFFGNAAYNMPSTRTTTTTTWLPNAASGAAWIIRDSQIGSMATHGTVGVSGMSRSSDGAGIGSTSAVGVAGYAISNRDNATGWASYLECQREANSNNNCFGAEIDVKNKGVNIIGTPFGLGAGGHALWLSAGGDNSYGGVSANPSTAAVTILNNSNTWNTGILFSKTGVTGCDGTGTLCIGIGMAIGQQQCWYSSISNKGCINGSSPDGTAVVMTLPATYTPPTSAQACSAGAMSWDASFVYICTASGVWKRATLAAF